MIRKPSAATRRSVGAQLRREPQQAHLQPQVEADTAFRLSDELLRVAAPPKRELLFLVRCTGGGTAAAAAVAAAGRVGSFVSGLTQGLRLRSSSSAQDLGSIGGGGSSGYLLRLREEYSYVELEPLCSPGRTTTSASTISNTLSATSTSLGLHFQLQQIRHLQASPDDRQTIALRHGTPVRSQGHRR